jgi:hypothetical protein
MSNSGVIPEDAKAQFWAVVRECLVEFHGKLPRASRAKVLQFRRRVEQYPKEAMELFYHNEPFVIACRIAKHRIPVDEHIKRYIEISDIEHPLKADG